MVGGQLDGSLPDAAGRLGIDRLFDVPVRYLSTGQRKRLAFIAAVLEGRPVCLFDELAADQDPGFRRRYYEELLPELKAAGRTLLIVSHDDAWFNTADRVLRLDAGHIVADEVPGPVESSS